MTQNVIVKGKDNQVVMIFSFTGDFAASGLNTFTSITIEIGSESYNTISDPDNISIESDTEIRLKIGDTTSLDVGYYQLQITGFSNVYDDGFLLTGTCKPILPAVRVC